MIMMLENLALTLQDLLQMLYIYDKVAYISSFSYDILIIRSILLDILHSQ